MRPDSRPPTTNRAQPASPAWKELRPLRGFNRLRADDETPQQYFVRIQSAGFSFPYLVVEQWLYPHYNNEHTVTHYGWIDYQSVAFTRDKLPLGALLHLNVIERYSQYVQSRSDSLPFNEFMCKTEDLAFWQAYGTWRVPPVVIDVQSFTSIPAHVQLRGPLQLIEGHTRLGYLYALDRAGILTVNEHEVFVLSHAG